MWFGTNHFWPFVTSAHNHNTGAHKIAWIYGLLLLLGLNLPKFCNVKGGSLKVSLYCHRYETQLPWLWARSATHYSNSQLVNIHSGQHWSRHCLSPMRDSLWVVPHTCMILSERENFCLHPIPCSASCAVSKTKKVWNIEIQQNTISA